MSVRTVRTRRRPPYWWVVVLDSAAKVCWGEMCLPEDRTRAEETARVEAHKDEPMRGVHMEDLLR